MPLPRAVDIPRIKAVLTAYRVSAIVTGVFLLLLCLMMVFRYGMGVDIEYTPAYGIQLQTRDQITAENGTNVSTLLLIIHGWLYVLYLALDFLLWRMARFSFGRFLWIALGGVIPFFSFFLEFRVPPYIKAIVAQVQQPAEVAA